MTEDIQSALDTIRTYQQDINASQESLRNLKEQIDEEIETTAGYDEVQAAKQALDAAKTHFKQNLLSNATYNNLLEEKAQISQKMKDQKEILSDHIVYLFKTTDERQVEVGGDGDARDIVVKGKLGRKGKYQQALL
jgi:hypothetical protein